MELRDDTELTERGLVAEEKDGAKTGNTKSELRKRHPEHITIYLLKVSL